jgi:2,4-dichlorophenol 6-monooxygenase
MKDLVGPGRFLLIAGEDGEAWCEAARAIADGAGLPLDALRIGHLDGDLLDPRCGWLRHREIERDGAILVRPDRFVAWRQATAAEDPRAVLTDALGQVLAQPIGTPTTSVHESPEEAQSLKVCDDRSSSVIAHSGAWNR